MAVGQNQWHHFGVGAPPILVYFSGDWDVHWGYGLLTHGHVAVHPQRKSRRVGVSTNGSQFNKDTSGEVFETFGMTAKCSSNAHKIRPQGKVSFSKGL